MKKGYLLIEVLIAVLIFVTVVVSIFSSVSFILRKTDESKYDTEATLLLQEGTEAAYNVLLSDWIGGGTYHPAVNQGEGRWVLVSGAEENIQAKFERRIDIFDACRDFATGDLELPDELGYSCDGVVDQDSKLIHTVITWQENESPKEIKADLLIIKPLTL